MVRHCRLAGCAEGTVAGITAEDGAARSSSDDTRGRPGTLDARGACERYPLSNEGTCYEPGEFCRTADHGKSGVPGDGKRITC
jgi:hypothetical protein